MDAVAGLGCACAGLVALVLLVVAQRLGLLYRLLHKVDAASPRHGGELVAEVLRAHGVRFLFTLPGGHISPVLVACEKMGIRVVDTRHEATAVFAADAVVPPWCHFEATLEPPWCHLDVTLEPLWRHFGATLEPPWCHFGVTLGPPWMSPWCHLGATVVPF
ncbi:hypothetical protein DUI87_35497 [Hirundo rustica rustica]|uniref:Thiamine pyrophosphate enzyme N-terminal TPP-binding domain-containing protein n=1 Tax=Hirundo rustica rustica TaxID=333673 RepID=A0A3M0J0I1_HIRRU|nr:hypothetical protein DUI87_35497 [Hirundo rustica rustica]